jgi:hypothetical protein
VIDVGDDREVAYALHQDLRWACRNDRQKISAEV